MLLLQPVAFGSVGSSTQLISGRHSSNPVRALIFLRTIHYAQLYLNSIHTSNEMCFITNRFLNHFKCRLPKKWPVDSQPSLLMWPLKLSAIIKHFWICRATFHFHSCLYILCYHLQPVMKKVIEDLIKKTALQGGMLVCSVILDCVVYTPLTKKTCQSYLNLNLNYCWNSPGLRISTISFLYFKNFWT